MLNSQELSILKTITILEARPQFIRAAEVYHAPSVTGGGGALFQWKEAYFFGVPCITLRPETEWVEIVEAGCNTVIGSDTLAVLQKAQTMQPPPESRRQLFGDGH